MQRITGSFFDIVHHNGEEAKYWRDLAIAYREPEWNRFMLHMKESGLDTIILIASVAPLPGGKALFPGHPFLPTHDYWGDFDPLGAAVSAADDAGLEFFMGLGYQEAYSHEIEHTPDAVKRTLTLAETLLDRYASHPSFKAWYIADEFGYNEEGCFNPHPVGYVSEVSTGLKEMTPDMPRMISPYFHTKCSLPDPARLIPQLERMDVDIVSVQNGANRPDIQQQHFVQLRKAFDKVDTAFWGNVELFAFEDPSQRRSPLIPGPIDRIQTQISWISPYAEKLISYQFMGLMNTLGLGTQPAAADLWHSYIQEYQGDA